MEGNQQNLNQFGGCPYVKILVAQHSAWGPDYRVHFLSVKMGQQLAAGGVRLPAALRHFFVQNDLKSVLRAKTFGILAKYFRHRLNFYNTAKRASVSVSP